MDKCEFPRCKNTPFMTYIQRSLCCEHWVQLAEADSETEKVMLKKLRLKKVENRVVPIEPKKKK